MGKNLILITTDSRRPTEGVTMNRSLNLQPTWIRSQSLSG